MFEKRVIDFAYYNQAAKYLLYRHFWAQEKNVVKSKITNRLKKKIMSPALRTLFKMLYAKKLEQTSDSNNLMSNIIGLKESQ